MTRIAVGDASLTSTLARQGAELRAQVARAATEVTTGRPVDLARTLRGDVAPLLAIDASLTRLAGFKTAISDLGGLSDLATGITPTLISSRDFRSPPQVLSVAAEARGRLESAVGLVNTQAAGRAVFSGVATDTPPLGSSDDLLLALETAVAAAGATTAAQVAAAVTTWFTDPAGYAAFYQGGAALSDAPIAPGETAAARATALDEPIRDTLAGLAMAALVDRGILAGNPDEQARLVERAGQELLGSQDARVTLAARIGSLEARIEAARTRNAAEETALGLLRSEIGSVDPYEAATRLEQARAQLESLYLVTARVARLSLVDFLR